VRDGKEAWEGEEVGMTSGPGGPCGAAGAPVQPIADRRETDVMHTDEGERQRIGHRAEIVAGVIRSGESLGGG
jgi:hypothetical protein